MIDIDDIKALRAWQARNRRFVYAAFGCFTAALLIANLIQIIGA